MEGIFLLVWRTWCLTMMCRIAILMQQMLLHMMLLCRKFSAVLISPGSGFWTGWWVLCLMEQLSWAPMWQG